MKDTTYNRHRGNAESNSAFATIQDTLSLRQNDVLEAFSLIGYPATSKEITNWLQSPLNAISGRITELKAKGLIKQIGRRDGCAVYQVTQ